jgi:hypothetical protein
MIRLYLWFCRVLFCCRRAMGAVGTRPSLRPLFFRGRFALITRTHSCRENAASRLPPPSCPAHAGHPVNIGLSAQSQRTLEYWIVRSSPIESGTGAGHDWEGRCESVLLFLQIDQVRYSFYKRRPPCKTASGRHIVNDNRIAIVGFCSILRTQHAPAIAATRLSGDRA